MWLNPMTVTGGILFLIGMITWIVYQIQYSKFKCSEFDAWADVYVPDASGNRLPALYLYGEENFVYTHPFYKECLTLRESFIGGIFRIIGGAMILIGLFS
jgi:hypothetical protein